MDQLVLRQQNARVIRSSLGAGRRAALSGSVVHLPEVLILSRLNGVLEAPLAITSLQSASAKTSHAALSLLAEHRLDRRRSFAIEVVSPLGAELALHALCLR